MVVEMFATLTQVICQSVTFLDLSVKCYNFHRATTFLFPRARDFGTAWRFNWAGPVWFCVPLLPSGDANGHEAPTEGRSPHHTWIPASSSKSTTAHCFGSATLWHLVTGFSLESGPSKGSATPEVQDCPPGFSSVSIFHPACPPYVGCPWIRHYVIHPQTTRLSFLELFMEPNDASGCLNTLPPEVRAGGPNRRQGAAKVSTRFHQGFHQRFHQRLHQGSPSFVVSLLLSPKSVLASNGSAEGSAKAPPRLHQGSTKVSKFFGVFASLGQVRVGFVLACQKVPWKVPPKFHATFVKFLDLSRLLGQIHFVSGKGCAEGSPITSLQLCLPVPLISFACSPTMLLALGSSAIVKVLAKWHVCFLFFATNGFSPPTRFFGVHSVQSLPRFLGKRQFASEKVLWSVPPAILYICLPNGCCFRKVLWRVPPTALYCALHVSPSLHAGVNVVWIVTCFNHTNPARRKGPIMSLLLGYSLGLFFPKITNGELRENPSCVKQTLQKTIKSKSREKVLHIAFPFPYKMHRDTKYHMFQCKNSEALWVDVFCVWCKMFCCFGCQVSKRVRWNLQLMAYCRWWVAGDAGDNF